ncbi:MAG: aminotransferase class V-fold PLP-dependent enzyme [Polyangiaceae bacterium]|nr:aminotransferase class V-fold PLP-dependent enzyme [Polyangiaceae bacterium]
MGLAELGSRALFPQLVAGAYLNHAAVSPPSLVVRQAVIAALGEYEREGVGAVHWAIEQRVRLKGALATLLGAAADDLALGFGTTRGLIDLALCMPLRPRERILLFAGEFPANVTPWQQVAERFGLEIVMHDARAFLDAPEQAWQRFIRELETGLRLVATSLVQFSTGLVMPVQRMAEAAHAHGAEICVDAIQALGVLPCDVRQLGVDYLVAGAHKWLMGVEGVGVVYVAPRVVASLRPVVAGWLSHVDPLGFLLQGPGQLRYDRPIRRSADFLEASAPNTLGAAALEASVGLLAELSVPAIFSHVQGYLDRLEPSLVQRGFRSLRAADPGARSALLCVLPPPGVDVVRLHAALNTLGVACSIPDGVLRFSPHWPNAHDEIPFVMSCLDRAL